MGGVDVGGDACGRRQLAALVVVWTDMRPLVDARVARVNEGQEDG